MHLKMFIKCQPFSYGPNVLIGNRHWNDRCSENMTAGMYSLFLFSELWRPRNNKLRATLSQ